jgi:5'-nucleotidase
MIGISKTQFREDVVTLSKSMAKSKPQILLTNDDSIDSPGLWAAAEALSEIGYVWVIAPREQSTSTGRSMPPSSDGLITPKKLTVHGLEWTIYAVGGTPAQVVQHGILEVIGKIPDLVVSGINYGLNLGFSVTASGTVGAALEGALYGVPSLAISLETGKEFHLSHSKEIDFQEAAKITCAFANKILSRTLDKDVQVLKIDIPADATAETPWEITALSPVRYYLPLRPKRSSWDQPGTTDYAIEKDLEKFPHDSDVYTVLAKRKISVTPLSLDMTARVDFGELDRELKK